MPPMRKVRPSGASFAATCVGVKKNTRFSLNAVSTSAAALPSATTPTRMRAMRLFLGVTRPLHEQNHFEREAAESHQVRAPDVDVVHPASRIMQRTRASDTAIAYIQNASAISSMPVSMVAAIVDALFRLTDAPWCSVFHHCTEK